MMKAFILTAISTLAGAVQLWNSPGDLPASIPAACRAALAVNITCSELVQGSRVAAQSLLAQSELTSLCTANCSASLLSFQSNAQSRCGQAVLALNGTNTTAGAFIDPLVWAQNVTCLRDGTTFCNRQLFNSTYKPCSNCALSYGARMLENSYGRGRVNEKGFSSQLSSCSVPASKYPHKTLTTATTPARSPTPTPLCNGKVYKVVAGDTCKSIAVKNSVAQDRLLAQNGIDYNCTTLRTGSTLCLGPTCQLYTVKTNDSCSNILQGRTFYLNQLVSWNPTLHENCDNIVAMAGRGICVSPPGSSKWDVVPTNSTTTTTSFTMFTGSFVAGSSATLASGTQNVSTIATTFKLSTTSVTANATAASLYAAYVTYCPISDDFIGRGYTVDDLPAACSNATSYCDPDFNLPKPTSTRWPAVCTLTTPPASSSTGTKPSPITPQTVDNCKAYYQVISSGDTCYTISTNFKITLSQFYTWNPYVGTDCKRLLQGYYVCVSA